MENKVILKTNKDQKANIYFIKSGTYIVFTSKLEHTAFELKLSGL